MTRSRNINLRWTPGPLRKLSRYLQSGLTYKECALLLNCTRNAIIGAVHRHGLKLTAEQALERQRRACYEREFGGRAPQWNTGKSDRQFIEPWTEYTARKKREREANARSSN